jgi:hypothetical protein
MGGGWSYCGEQRLISKGGRLEAGGQAHQRESGWRKEAGGKSTVRVIRRTYLELQCHQHRSPSTSHGPWPNPMVQSENEHDGKQTKMNEINKITLDVLVSYSAGKPMNPLPNMSSKVQKDTKSRIRSTS